MGPGEARSGEPGDAPAGGTACDAPAARDAGPAVEGATVEGSTAGSVGVAGGEGGAPAGAAAGGTSTDPAVGDVEPGGAEATASSVVGDFAAETGAFHARQTTTPPIVEKLRSADTHRLMSAGWRRERRNPSEDSDDVDGRRRAAAIACTRSFRSAWDMGAASGETPGSFSYRRLHRKTSAPRPARATASRAARAGRPSWHRGTPRSPYIAEVRIAALDLGSNSFHLLVADVHPDGTFEPLVGEKEMLRLGDVVSREGALTGLAADQVVATVRRFRMLSEAAGATEIVACATSAIRTASNGSAVVDRIEAETGVRVEVISGMREAELIFGAVRASVLIDPGPALCFDLGGGSVEITVGDSSNLHYATSEKLGVGRLTTDFVSTDPISKNERKALRDHITAVLRPSAKRVAKFEPKLVIGSSGTFEDLAHMIVARRDENVPVSLNQLRFTREEFEPLHKFLMSSKASERRKLEGLEARRVELIPAGSLFLATIMDLFEFDEMTVSEWALREGIVLDAIGHHDPADWSDDPRAIRRASVQSLARRCSWPEAHSRHVATLALELFDQTAELHEARPRRPGAPRVRRTAPRHRRARLGRRTSPSRGLPHRERPTTRLRSQRDPRARVDRAVGTVAVNRRSPKRPSVPWANPTGAACAGSPHSCEWPTGWTAAAARP